jgi:hypothetical protein
VARATAGSSKGPEKRPLERPDEAAHHCGPSERSIWNASEMNYLIGVSESRWLEISEIKLGQKGCDLFSVLRRGLEDDIEVAGVSGPAVKSQAMSTDYHPFNTARLVRLGRLLSSEARRSTQSLFCF